MRFEARLLLSHAAGLSIEQLIARGPDQAPAAVTTTLRDLTARRVRREPMAYILGEREFWGLVFRVSPAVLVPRPDSETVIETVLDLFPDRGRPLRIADLGLGSGCLLLTLLREYPQASGVGSTPRRRRSKWPAPTRRPWVWRPGRACWRATGESPAGRTSGWPVRSSSYQTPPYIESGTVDGLMPEVSRHEPRLALDGGADGLAAYRAIAADAASLVVPGGWAVVEGGEGQAAEIATLFAAAGFRPGPPRRDLAGSSG